MKPENIAETVAQSMREEIGPLVSEAMERFELTRQEDRDALTDLFARCVSLGYKFGGEAAISDFGERGYKVRGKGKGRR